VFLDLCSLFFFTGETFFLSRNLLDLCSYSFVYIMSINNINKCNDSFLVVEVV